jgi:cyanophycinase
VNHPGTLALAGSGEYLPGMEPVDRLLLSRLPGTPRVVCLPTAAGSEGPDVIGRWARMGVDHFTRLGAAAEAVDVVDRATADDEARVARVRSANFVYLSGGRPDYLYRALAGSRALDAIRGVLEQGGVVAGCSAGAMIWGGGLPRLSWRGLWGPGFDLLPGTVILPHFDEMPAWLAGALRPLLGRRRLVGIEGLTALVLSGGSAFVAGAGSVTVWERRPPQRYTGGQTVRLDRWSGR